LRNFLFFEELLEKRAVWRQFCSERKFVFVYFLVKIKNSPVKKSCSIEVLLKKRAVPAIYTFAGE